MERPRYRSGRAGDAALAQDRRKDLAAGLRGGASRVGRQAVAETETGATRSWSGDSAQSSPAGPPVPEGEAALVGPSPEIMLPAAFLGGFLLARLFKMLGSGDE